ncbi:ABC transporter ATP-binding protein [Aerococcaceae bacterium WGS1372]
MLEIKNLTTGYTTNKDILKAISLTVPAGSIYGFIGPNGSGKSTTIKSIIGILPFKEGDIMIDGRSVRKEPLACKSVTTYVQDNPEIYPYLTGQQYLDFIGDMYDVAIDVRQQRIESYSQRLKFQLYLNQIVSSYSHGTKQKLAIIGALLSQPKLLVLDEPFVGLDPEATMNLRMMMRDLCDQGSSVFFSTHVLEVAQKICDKIAMIRDGKIVIEGNTQDLIQSMDLEQVFLKQVQDNDN